MFEQVDLLLSFVYAIALTHILTSCTELIWARKRVVFCGRQAVWMFSACLFIINNWLYLEALHKLPHWTIGVAVLEFAGAVVQYFACSLISYRPPEHGVADMVAFYERQRPAIFTPLVLEPFIIAIQNQVEGAALGLTLRAAVISDGINLGLLALVLAAGWAKPRWLQWGAGIAMIAAQLFFMARLDS